MGCHTWHFFRTERTEEEIRALAKKSVEKTMSWADINQMQIENPTQWDTTERKWINCMKKRRHQLEFGTWNQIMELACESLPGVAHVYRGHIYEDAGYHDVFRVYDYPENVLTSMKATKAFIAKWQREKPDYISLDEPTAEWPGSVAKLEEFWAKYPNGLIHFG